jgi:hypothetical protein
LKQAGLIVIVVLVQAHAYAAVLQKCTICHAKPDIKKIADDGTLKYLFVDERKIKKTVHHNNACTDCHSDVTEIPHRLTPKRVNCVRCHYKGNPKGAPQDVDYQAYERSVHGMAVRSGNQKAPYCQDCHGTHEIRAHTDMQSRIFRENIPQLCRTCHAGVYDEYAGSVHGGALIKQKNPDVPVCTGCHGEHNIISPKEPASTVYPTHVAESCSRCHGREAIMSNYGIRADQVKTYKESFHGIAGKFGMRTVANCSSCHGVHDIRAPDDPMSSVNINNIPGTCGKCHPGANINYAKGKIHVNPKLKEAGSIYWVSSFFKWLTILTMMGLAGHITLDLFRKMRERRTSPLS